MSTAADIDTQKLIERFSLKAFVESCLVLEEGVATIRDIDLAMMTGFGILPGPFARADDQGLDDVLAALDLLVDITSDEKGSAVASPATQKSSAHGRQP